MENELATSQEYFGTHHVMHWNQTLIDFKTKGRVIPWRSTCCGGFHIFVFTIRVSPLSIKKATFAYSFKFPRHSLLVSLLACGRKRTLPTSQRQCMTRYACFMPSPMLLKPDPLAPVVQRVDSTYPLSNPIYLGSNYPLDSNIQALSNWGLVLNLVKIRSMGVSLCK